jgi:5-amino-6-(5-phosphoribosylamino)uracil reductase
MKVLCSLATSLDAKLTPPDVFTHVELTSKADIAKLKELRDRADAIVFGGGSFRAFPRVRKGFRSDAIPLQCVVTHDGNLQPGVPAFRRSGGASFIVFSNDVPAADLQEHYPADVAWVQIGERDTPAAIVDTILGELCRRSVSTLLLEGGGFLVGLFLQARRIDELFLTYSPHLFGDRKTPDMVQGIGFSEADAPRAELVSVEKVGNEIFVHAMLHYRP